jgi:hypothetical protein
LLSHEFFLAGFEIRLFYSNDHGKKLVFETVFCDNEINDCTLGSGFGLVVRVEELGLEIKFEVGVDFNIL